MGGRGVVCRRVASPMAATPAAGKHINFQIFIDFYGKSYGFVSLVAGDLYTRRKSDLSRWPVSTEPALHHRETPEQLMASATKTAAVSARWRHHLACLVSRGPRCSRLRELPRSTPLVAVAMASPTAVAFALPAPEFRLAAAAAGRALRDAPLPATAHVGVGRRSVRPTVAWRMVAPAGPTPTPAAADGDAAGGGDAGHPNDGEVMLSPSLAIPGVLLSSAALSATAGGGGGAVAAFPLGLLGAFLAFQAYYIRFVFTATELRVAKRSDGGWKTERGWAYSGWVNWELWWPAFPVLCYFREKDSYEGAGSPHFFPVIFNANQLLRALQTRTGIAKDNYPTPPP